MSEEEEEERRRRNQIIRNAAGSSLVSPDERSLLLDTVLDLERGAEPGAFTRWRVRRIVGRVVAG